MKQRLLLLFSFSPAILGIAHFGIWNILFPDKSYYLVAKLYVILLIVSLIFGLTLWLLKKKTSDNFISIFMIFTTFQLLTAMSYFIYIIKMNGKSITPDVFSGCAGFLILLAIQSYALIRIAKTTDYKNID